MEEKSKPIQNVLTSGVGGVDPMDGGEIGKSINKKTVCRRDIDCAGNAISHRLDDEEEDDDRDDDEEEEEVSRPTIITRRPSSILLHSDQFADLDEEEDEGLSSLNAGTMHCVTHIWPGRGYMICCWGADC